MKTAIALFALMIGLSSCSKKEDTATPAPVDSTKYVVKMWGTHKKPQMYVLDNKTYSYGIDGTGSATCYNFISSTAITLPFEQKLYAKSPKVQFIFEPPGGGQRSMECNYGLDDTLYIAGYRVNGDQIFKDTLYYTKIHWSINATYIFY